MNLEALVVAEAMLVVVVYVIISMHILSSCNLVYYSMPQIDCVNA
jgi:hypothetical protein